MAVINNVNNNKTKTVVVTVVKVVTMNVVRVENVICINTAGVFSFTYFTLSNNNTLKNIIRNINKVVNNVINS